MSALHSFTADVMAFFRAHPERWIEATRLEAIGGRQAWRTRISDARQAFQAAGEGTILNRQRRMTQDGKVWTLSEYLFQPSAPASPSAPHDLNVAQEGRLI